MAESSNSSSLGYEVTTSLATGSVEISVAEYENLKEEILMLRSKMQERNKDFENLLSDMDHMKAVTKNLLLHHKELGKTDSNDQESVVKSVSESRTENDDSGYAGSYAHFGIHHEMLSDYETSSKLILGDHKLKRSQAQVKCDITILFTM